jgi:hypothetical protein
MPEPEPGVRIRIEHKPVTPFQKQAWDKFWAKMIDETKIETKDGNKGNWGSFKR